MRVVRSGIPARERLSPPPYHPTSAPPQTQSKVALGLWAYAWPKLSHPARVTLGPVHTFLGRAILGLGLAAAAVGLQEKATFLQLGAGAGPASAALRLPALLQLLLAAVALGVLWHHVEPARPGPGVVSLAGDGIPLFEQRTPRNSADH